MTPEARQRLRDVVEACRLAAEYTAGLDYAAYEGSRLVRDAVERRLTIVGEALNRAAVLQPGLVEQIPDLREIVAMRHRIVHGYDAIDDALVWDVVRLELPLLATRLAALLEEDELA